jgi:hypothetical protein
MTDSWWVRSVRDLDWTENAMGTYCLMAADELAVNLNVLGNGQPMALYHHEPHQEGFLVLRGGEATYPNDPDPAAAYAAYGEPKGVPSPL